MADRYGEIGFQWKHEHEADVVGLRYVMFSQGQRLTHPDRSNSILALAGFDPHAALEQFSHSIADLHEIRPKDREQGDLKTWTKGTHPSPELRMAVMRGELERWEKEAAKRA